MLSPCLVVCDEGHRIKNSLAGIARALQKIKTKRRIVLTGYPLQNNLIEYWCMVDFVRPNYLGTKSEFLNMFERPIMNGQCMDSTREDIKLMRYRAHVLHSLLEGFVQRRGHDVFFASLPKKQEYIILLKMSPIQKGRFIINKTKIKITFSNKSDIFLRTVFGVFGVDRSDESGREDKSVENIRDMLQDLESSGRFAQASHEQRRRGKRNGP